MGRSGRTATIDCTHIGKKQGALEGISKQDNVNKDRSNSAEESAGIEGGPDESDKRNAIEWAFKALGIAFIPTVSGQLPSWDVRGKSPLSYDF